MHLHDAIKSAPVVVEGERIFFAHGSADLSEWRDLTFKGCTFVFTKGYEAARIKIGAGVRFVDCHFDLGLRLVK